jgi:hypothetical protein
MSHDIRVNARLLAMTLSCFWVGCVAKHRKYRRVGERFGTTDQAAYTILA